jgi:tetratricopeptide (TPR) repeat protein
MSGTLKLAERLLAMGRDRLRAGRTDDALAVLRRLAEFPELPAPVAEETHRLLGELLFDRQQYRAARRHLAASLRCNPGHAGVHYLMGLAYEHDSEADPRRAVRHFRLSLLLAPEQPRCLRDYGESNLRRDRTASGLRLLRRAVELAPDDVELLESLVEALAEVGRHAEAASVLRDARFRFADDPRFGRLWGDFQLRRLGERQQASAAAEGGPKPADAVLPFRRPAAEQPVRTRRRFRRVDAASAPAPHLPRPALRRFPKHAP